MAEPVVHGATTTSFLERLAAIESFLADTASTPRHLEQSFQFTRLWAGPAGSPER